MNVPPQDIEDTIGGFAHCNVFWTDDYDLLGKVMDVPTLTIRSDSRRTGIEQLRPLPLLHRNQGRVQGQLASKLAS